MYVFSYSIHFTAIITVKTLAKRVFRVEILAKLFSHAKLLKTLAPLFCGFIKGVRINAHHSMGLYNSK